jgi:hypothetical protein
MLRRKSNFTADANAMFLNGIRILLLAMLCSICSACATETRAENCKLNRITDEKAISFAIADLNTRIKNFSALNYKSSVTDVGCDLRVEIEHQREERIGRKSSLLMDRKGVVKRYFGGM